MDTVLYAHRLETFAQVCQVFHRYGSSVFKRAQILRKLSPQFCDLQHFDSRNFRQVVGGSYHIIRDVLERHKVRQRPLVGVGHAAGKQIQRILQSASVQNFYNVMTIIAEVVDRKDCSVWFTPGEFVKNIEFSQRERFDLFAQFVQRGVEQALYSKSVRSYLQGHKFTMPRLTFLIRDAHLANSEPRRKYCRASTDESLKIVYEISPAVPSLARNAAWQTKQDGQNDSRSNRQKNHDEYALLVKFRHRFPLKPTNFGNRSHFFSLMRSELASLAS